MLYFIDVSGQLTDDRVATTLDKRGWYHIAFTYDGSYLRWFVNGELEAQNSSSGTMDGTIAENLKIGASYVYSNTFNGIIDEVRIYNRALSEEEIRAHYLQGLRTHGLVQTNKFRILDTDNTVNFQVDASGNAIFAGAITSQGTATSTFAGPLQIDSKLTVSQSGAGNIVDFKSSATSIFTLASADRLKLRDGLLATFGEFNDQVLDDFEDGDISNWSSSDSSNTTLATTTSAKVNDIALTIQTTAGASAGDLITTPPSITDWSSYERIGFWIKAEYTTTSTSATTTQIISIQFHDTGGNTQTHNITIQEMGSWQYEEWDISTIASTDKDNIDWFGFRIDNDYGSPKFYIDQIRLYGSAERSAEIFVDADGSLNILAQKEIQLTRTTEGSALPGLTLGSANVVLNQPLEVNVPGDVGIDYDLYFANTGLSTISSEGPLKISAGDPNSYENLTITTGGTGDVIIDIAGGGIC